MIRSLLLPCFLLALLTACENDAASLQFDGREDSVSLVREQRWFWSSEVEQTLIPARTQACQRRFPIKPGATDFVKIELYEVRPMLYLANQGRDWYVIGTEQCQVQTFKDSVPTPPGKALGKFVRKDGKIVFEASK